MAKIFEMQAPAPAPFDTTGKSVQGAFEVHAPGTSGDPMLVKYLNASLGWTPHELAYRDASGQLDYITASAPVPVITKGTEARYKRPFPDAEDVYLAQAGGMMKHYTVLYEAPRPPAEYLSLGVEFGLSGGLSGVTVAPGEYLTINTPDFHMPRPIVSDLNGNTAEGRYEVVEAADGTLQLYVWFPASYFAGAVYPVTIDPTVTGINYNGALSTHNQRKLARYSDGKLVLMYSSTDGYISLLTSADEGSTWTKTVNINTDATVVPPTGAVRVADNDILYVTFGPNSSLFQAVPTNAARTTFTKSPNYRWDNGSDTSRYSDLEVFTLANGDHVVWGAFGSYYGPVKVRPCTFAGKGATGVMGTAVALSAGTAQSVPAIAKDPNKNIGVVFGSGTTGAGLGLRFSLGTFNGTNAWSWLATSTFTEPIDEAVTPLSLTLGVDSQGRWVTAYWSSVSSTLVVKRRNGPNNWVNLGTLPALGLVVNSGVQLLVDRDDVYVAYVTGDGTNPRNVWYIKYIGSTGQWTGPIQIGGPDDKTYTQFPQVYPGTDGGKFRVLYQGGAVTTTTFNYVDVPLNANPLAPTVATGADAFDNTVGVDITITRSDPDPSDVMAAYWLKRVFGNTTEYWNAATKAWQATAVRNPITAASSVTIPKADNVGDWTNGTTYALYAMTEDVGGAQGPYSTTPKTVVASAKPVVSITSPFHGGSVTTSNVSVQWTYSDAEGKAQAEATVTLYDDVGNAKGTPLYQEVLTGGTYRAKTLAGYSLVNGTTYWVGVKAKDSDGVYGDEVFARFQAAFNGPRIPSVALAVLAGGKVTATPTNPAPRLNILTANQSSVETDNTGFNPVYCSLVQDTTKAWQGLACLKATCNLAGSGATFGPYLGGSFSVTPGTPYAYSVYVQAGLGNLNMVHSLEWKDNAGAIITSITAPGVTLTSNWQRISVVGVAPAGAVTCTPTSYGVGGALGDYFYLDGFQLEQASDASEWIIGGSTHPAVISTDLYRRLAGESWTCIAKGIDAGYTDYTLPSGKDHEYKVVANGDNNTSAESPLQTATVTFPDLIIHDVADPAGTALALSYNVSRDHSLKLDMTTMKFAGRSKRVAEFGDFEDGDYNFGVMVLAAELGKYDALVNLFRRRATLCVRDNSGRKVFGVISDLPSSEQKWGYNMTLRLIETDYSEAV